MEEQPFHEHVANVCMDEESKVTLLSAMYLPSQSCSHSVKVVREENMLDGILYCLTHSIKEEFEEMKENFVLSVSPEQSVP